MTITFDQLTPQFVHGNEAMWAFLPHTQFLAISHQQHRFERFEIPKFQPEYHLTYLRDDNGKVDQVGLLESDFESLRDVLQSWEYYFYMTPLPGKLRTFELPAIGLVGYSNSHGDEPTQTTPIIVLKGSVSCSPCNTFRYRRDRDRLIDDVLEDRGSHAVFIRNHQFESPRMAASIVRGYEANGWDCWESYRRESEDFEDAVALFS